MDDRDIVAAITAGDDDGIAYAYDKYAASLYGYCRWLTPEPADIAVPVQDTFILAAARLGALRDPTRLRPWLYAVARNECRRMPRHPVPRHPMVRKVPPGDGAELARALDELDPAEREVMELNLRHHLAGGNLAAVLGVSRSRVHALVSQARDRLEKSLGRPLDRAALARPATPPRALREEVLRACADDSTEAAAYREWVTRRAGRFGSDGFPQPAMMPRRMLAITGAVAAATLIGVASTGIITVLALSGAHASRSLDAIRPGGGPPAASTGPTQNAAATRGPSAGPSALPTPGASASGTPKRDQPSVGGLPLSVPPSSQHAPPSSPGSAQPDASASPSPSASPSTAAPALSGTPTPGLQWPPAPSPTTGFP
jgi:DNA-directed RNA polymerase specialized sigma24 family protein